MGERKIKKLRRVIIFICLIILVIVIFTNLPESKYYDKELEQLVNQKKAQVIEVNKDMKIDKDTITIKRIINTEDKTYIRFTYKASELGWTFPNNAIEVFDETGKQYRHRSGKASGKLWGQDQLAEIDKIDEDAKSITLKLDWYDRKTEMAISLDKEKSVNENK